MPTPLICGFIKARNEIVREGNIYRAINNLRNFCDVIVACDDASTDGTREYLQKVIDPDKLILVPAELQDFRHELLWKQKMLEIVHRIQPHWIYWADADEELEPRGVEEIRAFCEAQLPESPPAYRFHYTQFWRSKDWARIDDGFDEGWFIKLWKYTPKLEFEVKQGTHHAQFPKQLLDPQAMAGIQKAPWEVLHWGNYGQNLVWKCIQYHGGLGGVSRHLDFERAAYRVLVAEPNKPKPLPFEEWQKARIKGMANLKQIEGLFTVVIPTHNRASTLPQALNSLRSQLYPHWVAIVLDDGSTDNTPEVMRTYQDLDPRIFYARYPKMGAVAMNEIGMDLACEWSSWWTRLGSDDWFEPSKLLLDAHVLSKHEACFGPYRVVRRNIYAELCNKPMLADQVSILLDQGNFVASWANIAARTSVLKAVKAKYGNYVDPELRSMEDLLFNVRMARTGTRIVWHGTVDGDHYIDPGPEVIQRINLSNVAHDAIWRVAEDGASSDTGQTGQDHALSLKIIKKEREW